MMEGPCAPSTSGRAMLPSLSTSSLLIGMLLASCALASAQWVVETNSFHIREPANVEGEYDSAIGDVSLPAACCPKSRLHTGMVHACCARAGGSKVSVLANAHFCHACITMRGVLWILPNLLHRKNAGSVSIFICGCIISCT